MTRRYGASLLLAILLSPGCAQSDGGDPDPRSGGIAMGEPVDVGMSALEMSRIGPAMEDIVEDGRTGGVVTLVARDGVVVHWEAHGWRLIGEDPLERDDVFRIYSMTKPVTSVAVMMLVEEGLLDLEQPLSGVLPAFADVRVYDDGQLRPPARPITIRDLLRHTAGLTYGIFSDTPVDSMYVAELDPLAMHSGRDLEATVGIVAQLPLLADPGTLWHYSMATDVLGRVVEVVSGATLADFFRTRIFEPLGMDDTAFHVEEHDRDRLTAVYAPGDTGLVVADPPDGSFARPPSWYSGGGGLTSTASDYLRFAQMLLNEGELDDVRILEPETVRLMRSNQLDEALLPIQVGVVPQDGFGLGFAVSVDGPEAGTYSWLGAASTWFWIDPVEELVVFAWTQFMPVGAVRVDQPLRQIVSEAIVESNRVPRAGVGNR
ncbi:MAG: serine hydrolase domain-containing protein [Longimicrobiales bacterium]|nr:serine hydrolase domain-containing protein [Longimicrobiales bacterium]